MSHHWSFINGHIAQFCWKFSSDTQYNKQHPICI
jgi:hypothetical protein